MIHEMKQPPSALVSAMIFLDMKKSPEEGMKTFAQLFLNAAYPNPDLLLS
jgi:hypothetical protein